jgi:LPS-assembly lipoprotein
MRTLPTLAAFALAALAGGCGFHPLYGSGPTSGVMARTLSSIYVDPISDLDVANTGYDLRNSMIQSLNGNDEAAAYHLHMTLAVATQGIALEDNASITRYNDTLTVTYALTDSATGKVVKKGTETGLSAYDVVASPYATLAAQQDADRRVAQDIADRIRIDLGVFFYQQRGGQ